MDALILPILDTLDDTRGWILRKSLANRFLKAIFLDRALRLFSLFVLSCAIYFPLSCSFPLWVLLAGPIIYGVPHIYSSLRFAQRSIAAAHEASPRFVTFHFLALIWVAVLALRLVIQLDLTELPDTIAYTNAPELLATLVTAIGCWFLYRRSKLEFVLSLVLLAPLGFASWYAPGETLGALILIHNAVAFVFWIRASRDRRERVAAVASLLLFVIANALIFSGLFDRWIGSAASSIGNGAMSIEDIGHMIAPWSESVTLAYHCVVAYAFGQALHYFIWLKAIPDQEHDRSVPTTFRQSYSLLRGELGRLVIGVMIATSIVGLAYWACLELSVARGIYFSIAAYHGYLEMGVLAVALASRRRGSLELSRV